MVTVPEMDVSTLKQALDQRLVTNMEALEKFQRYYAMLPLRLLYSLNRHSYILKKPNLSMLSVS